jgi:S1-C subfamily serine protease
MVLTVDRRSAASANGFRPGDLILAIGDQDVSTTRQLESALTGDLLPEEWQIKIDRRGQIGVIPTRYLPRQ